VISSALSATLPAMADAECKTSRAWSAISSDLLLDSLIVDAIDDAECRASRIFSIPPFWLFPLIATSTDFTSRKTSPSNGLFPSPGPIKSRQVAEGSSAAALVSYALAFDVVAIAGPVPAHVMAWSRYLVDIGERRRPGCGSVQRDGSRP